MNIKPLADLIRYGIRRLWRFASSHAYRALRREGAR